MKDNNTRSNLVYETFMAEDRMSDMLTDISMAEDNMSDVSTNMSTAKIYKFIKTQLCTRKQS